MGKRHGPNYQKSKRPLEACRDCRGTGLVKGVFHEMVCFTCNGGGVVLKENGEALTSDELVVELRLRLTERGERIRTLEAQLVALQPYIEAKRQADIAEEMYPSEHMKQRADAGRGGYGD